MGSIPIGAFKRNNPPNYIWACPKKGVRNDKEGTYGKDL